MKKIKSIGINIFVLVALIATLSSCSKNKDERTRQLLLGTWTLEHDPLCKWTFTNYTDDEYGYTLDLCSISVDTFRASGYWGVQGNTLGLSLSGAEGVLSIDKITKKKLVLSGYIDFRDSDEITYIDYVFKK